MSASLRMVNSSIRGAAAELSTCLFLSKAFLWCCTSEGLDQFIIAKEGRVRAVVADFARVFAGFFGWGRGGFLTVIC